MNANLLEITARKKAQPFSVVDPTDFEFSEGPAIDPQIVLTNPLISLYCLDHDNHRALFVETSSGIDLSQAPFIYQAQYNHTIKVISVPYEILHQLASAVSLDDQCVFLMYSTGRTGSTLLGAALNAAEGIVGLSEPDVFTQLVAYREWDGSNETDIRALVESCIKLQCKPTEQIPKPAGWAIKFRSFSIELGDLLFERFPNTKNIFLYRQAEAYLNSMLRAFGQYEQDIEARTGLQEWLSRVIPAITKYVQTGGPLLTTASLVSIAWITVLERYLELYEMGMPAIAMRYRDLKANPHKAFQKIFEYCSLPTTNMEAVYQVLEKDSQAGTAIAQDTVNQRSNVLTDAHLADLAQVLKDHPVIKSPDFIVPATWIPNVVSL